MSASRTSCRRTAEVAGLGDLVRWVFANGWLEVRRLLVPGPQALLAPDQVDPPVVDHGQEERPEGSAAPDRTPRGPATGPDRRRGRRPAPGSAGGSPGTPDRTPGPNSVGRARRTHLDRRPAVAGGAPGLRRCPASVRILPAVATVVLYSRPGCHLCDEARVVILGRPRGRPLRLRRGGHRDRRRDWFATTGSASRWSRSTARKHSRSRWTRELCARPSAAEVSRRSLGYGGDRHAALHAATRDPRRDRRAAPGVPAGARGSRGRRRGDRVLRDARRGRRRDLRRRCARISRTWARTERAASDTTDGT